MSLLSKLVQKVAPIAATFGKLVPGVGTAVSLAGTAATAYYAARNQPSAPPSPTAMPGTGYISPPSSFMNMQRAGMTGFTSLVPAAARAGGAMVVRGAKAAYRSAASYCRKHPGWCQTIGGIAAVEAMVSSGQLPVIKSRRGRGITATELKNFKRVARFTSKYCAPVRKAMKAPAMRRKSCQ